MSSIEEKFSGSIAQIAVGLGLISEMQSQDVLSVQARFSALAEKEVPLPESPLEDKTFFEDIQSIDGWRALAHTNGISTEDSFRHYMRAISGDGFEDNNVPASGDIAVAFGYISEEESLALTTAQEAVRT